MSSTALEREKRAFLESLRERHPGRDELHQAVTEVVDSVLHLVLDDDELRDQRVLERLTEPDRVVTFRVTWHDDDGGIHVNRAHRVQWSNALGPYKGGLRFHPNVDVSTLAFLGFEQTLKGALTGLPLGGAKGGADLDPKQRSDREIMRFCQSLMDELWHWLGEDVDVPAGDIGVGSREIGWLFGHYKRLTRRFTGSLTGKDLAFGGSRVRQEATGFGAVAFADRAMKHAGDSLEGKTCVVSGAGNVALHAVHELLERNARVVAISDSGGTLHVPKGFDPDLFAAVADWKADRSGRLAAFAEERDLEFRADATPWSIECDAAFPCATQNELDGDDARRLVENGVRLTCEGANMPCTGEAVAHLRDSGVIHLPGKAANAGGVAVSGFEIAQNAQGMTWSRERVHRELDRVMCEIHDSCVAHGEHGDGVDYVHGANRASFLKVARALVAQGIT